MNEQVEGAPVKKSSRRKDRALGGQLSPHQKAQANVRGTMDRLDQMAAQMNSGGASPAAPVVAEEPVEVANSAVLSEAAAAETPAVAPAPQAAVTAEAEAEAEQGEVIPVGLAVPITSLQQLKGLIEALPSNKDKLFAKVPMQLIKPSPDNHRRFALDFRTFKEHLPETPANWRELSPEDYVEQYWQPILTKLVDDGKLHPRELEKEQYRLRTAFGIALSAETETQIHTTSGYLKFDSSGQPDFVEICSGEQRYRGFLMVGNPEITMDFKSDAATVGVTPEIELSRTMSRAAENIKNTGVSVDEVLEALASAYQQLITIKGYEAVKKMSNEALAEEFKSGFNFSKATRNRYFQIIKHAQSKLLIDLCDWFGIALRPLAEVASRADKLAAAYGRDAANTTAADVYAAAYVVAEVKGLETEDIPDDIRDAVLMVAKEEAVLAEALPGAVLAERAQQLAVEQSVASATEEPAEAGAEDTDDAQAGPRRQRYPKSEAGKLLQRRLGWSVNKGQSWKDTHQQLYVQTLEQVLIKEHPNKPSPERFAQLRELARLKDNPDDLDNFRVGILEVMMDYNLSLEAMDIKFHETMDLIDQLEASDNALEAYSTHLSEKRNAVMETK